MRYILNLLTGFSIIMTACAQPSAPDQAAETPTPPTQLSLDSYFSTSEQLAEDVNKVFDGLSERDRVAQMIITSLGAHGKPIAAVEPLVISNAVGGIIFLSGDPAAFKEEIKRLDAVDEHWPLLMSMDAEPSLFNRRMPGTPEMKPTAELKTPAEIEGAVQTINATLKDVGFQHNYAPVIDVSPNNEAIGNRTMGSDSASIVPLATTFIKRTQQDQIIATAKHFPGHGRVQGDTHKKLVFIDGPLTEVSLYKPMIEAGVLSIMVGHIAIRNNEDYGTNELPSTLSDVVVTKLLRNEMKFEGLIITDAMNMGAVAIIPNSTLLDAKAGCDLILMPPNELETIDAILEEMKIDKAFQQQINASVKRIIRMKLCLGMSF